MNSSQLYQQALLEHHKKPYGFEQKIAESSSAHGRNIACGDEISIKIKIEQQKITQLAFFGDSCAICRASASLLCQHMETLPMEQVKETITLQLGKLKKITRSEILFENKFEPLNVVAKFPVRKQCATLPWETLLKALNKPIEVATLLN